MEEVIRILLAAIIGTSLMTLFSYFASKQWESPFREPILLNKLLYRSPFYTSKTLPVLPGWFFHYFMGLIFVLVYHFIWVHTELNPTIMTGMVFGFLNGFVGIAGWAIVFKMHPDPPFINSKK